MPLPPNRRQKKPAPRTEEPPTQPLKRRRPKFQFPLYILIMMMTVIGMALAPASYFMRVSSSDNHSTRMWYLILMLAWPMLMVIFIHTAVRMYWLLRRR